MTQYEHVKNVADVAVGTIIVATWVEALPAIAAGLGIVYTVARLIIEWPKLKRTVLDWFL